MPDVDIGGLLAPARRRWRWARKNVRKRTRKHVRNWPRYKKRAHRYLYAQWNKRNRRSYGARLDRVPARDELPAVLNARRLFGQGAEIGVKTGKFSDYLLQHWKGAQLISIDPWLEDTPDAYVDHANVAQSKHEEFYEQTKARLRPYGPRSQIWRLTSVDAAVKIPDHSLDFVYIDARHDYDSVVEDLNAWFSKVKAGGILAGHDYADGSFPQGEFGVKRAVDEFFGARGITVHATEGRRPAELFATWLVQIPATSGSSRPPAGAAAS
jgi:hypothetical protein